MRSSKGVGISAAVFAVVFLLACNADLVVVDIGIPDDPIGYCRLDGQNRLLVVVLNKGVESTSAESTTRVTFPGFSGTNLVTPVLAAGASTALGPVAFPSGCFNPDCDFQITVDVGHVITELDEANNTVEGLCLG